MENVKSFKVYFDGHEKDLFRTFFGSLSLTHFLKNNKTSVSLLASAFSTKEQERYDIQGQYWLTQTETSENLGVGTYMQHSRDAYISVVEALKHGGIPLHTTIDIKWVDSEELTTDNVGELLGDVNGILVPGGFGIRGVEGKILAARYARENNIPYLGLCLGMQVAIIEFARHVCGYNDAHSIELDPNTTHPVIALMPDQNGVEDIGGTLRLGAYPCVLDKDSKACKVYGTTEISERHRHRYEVNNDYRTALVEHGMKLCGTSPDGRIVEMIELPDHPWFIATQAHPELKSRPNRPHPLFRGFVESATKCKR